MLTAVRERLADDLDAPGALAVVDGWADEVLGTGPGGTGPGGTGPDGSRPGGSPAPAEPAVAEGLSAAQLVRDTVDALLGIVL